MFVDSDIHFTFSPNYCLKGLINLHVRGAMHHSLVHAVYTRHPSASSVVRLALRWVASHMMSDMITHETIELIVVKVYMEPTGKLNSFVNAPLSTAVAGFIKFLHLISTHDWARCVIFHVLLLRQEFQFISSRTRFLGNHS